MSVKIKGMDVSWYQGKISVSNFKKAKESGIQFVILKLGYTGSSNYTCKEESVFRNNYTNAKAAGLPVGIYYYSLANSKSEARREAEFTVRQLKGLKIDYPVYLDMEDSAHRQYKCSKGTLALVCDEWCKVIAAAGYIPGVYASTSWFNNKIGTITEPHTKWVAQYHKECQYKGSYDMWQYSSKEGVPGISSKTDVNWCYKNFVKKSEPQEQEKKPEKKLKSYNKTFPKLPVRGYFKRGDNSKQVKYLQLFLNWYNEKYYLVIDGCIGTKTIRAIERFQKDMGLAVDGLFGKKCLKKAKEVKK